MNPKFSPTGIHLREDPETREDNRVTTEAEAGVLQLQGKDTWAQQQPLEVERPGHLSLSPRKGTSLAHVSTLEF